MKTLPRTLPASGSALAVLILPVAARAHSPIEGAGEFYNGLLHPILVPAQLLVLIGLGLWLGQQEPRRIEAALIGFALSLLTGLGLSGFVPATPLQETVLLGLALAAGGLVAVAKAIPRTIAAVFAGLCGLALGVDSPVDSESLGATLIVLAGTWVGAHLILLNLVAIAAFAKRVWMKIGVRVVGSWVAASALLVLALAFKRT